MPVFLLDHPVYLFMILAIVFAASFQLGSVEGRRYKIEDPERRTQVSSVQTALLALVGLMLGFTFAMALSRFDLRRRLVVDEADSIGTIGLRASLLPDKYRTEIDSLLRDYVTARLNFFGAGNDPARVTDSIRRSHQLQQRLWADAESVARERPDPITASFIQSLNQTIDMCEKRLDALENRIPMEVWWMLVLVAIAGCFLTGSLHSQGLTPAVLALPVVLAAVLGLIADLDSPRSGLIRVSQRSLMRLHQQHLYQGPVNLDADD